MPLIKCPDCGKEISDTAPACIGCGRVMASPPSVKTAAETKTIERKGGKYELIGTLLILGSMLGCMGGIATDAGSGWIGTGIVGFAVGCVVFLYGRFF